MNVIVMNYTDWIGYHLVEALLDEGYTVKGIALKSGNESLGDFFARNANFSLYEDQDEELFEFAVSIGDSDELTDINAKRKILINPNESSETDDFISIRTGILFGEWMPMDEESFYHNGKRIKLTSKEFKNDGIYIGDFIKVCMEWLKKSIKVNNIYLEAERKVNNKTEKLDNLFSVKENMPIEKNIEQVMSHYKRYQALYPLENNE